MRLRQAPARPLLTSRTRPLAAALLAGCVVVIAALGAWVAHRTQATPLDARIDAPVAARFAGHPRAIGDIVSIGNAPQVTLICAVLVLACAVTRRYRGALLAAVAVAAAAAITEDVLKPLFGRTLAGDLSYPSGHVTAVSAIAVSVVLLLAGPAGPPWPAALRWAIAVVALLLVAAVAVGVIALHMHYFTDTIGGAAVGTGTVLLTALVLDGLGGRLARGKPDRQEPRAAAGLPRP